MSTKRASKTLPRKANSGSLWNGLSVSPGVVSPLKRISTLTSPKKVRQWLGLTLATMGAELARLTGRERAFDRRTVFGWESGKPMAQEIMDAYGTKIANKLTTEMGRTIGVRVVANSPWHVTAWVKCVECSNWFQLHRAKQRRCDGCRARTDQGQAPRNS